MVWLLLINSITVLIDPINGEHASLSLLCEVILLMHPSMEWPSKDSKACFGIFVWAG